MVSKESDIVIACCRDESDIIEAFIDFYLDQGFDFVCLVDNGSKDDTVEKILNHPNRVQIRFYQDHRLGYDVRLFEYYSRFMALASRWVFFIDIDEFIPIPNGIKKFAESLPPHTTALELNSAEMIPNCDSSYRNSPLCTVSREASSNQEHKIVWKVGYANKIYCGKHAIGGSQIISQCDKRLLIRHFHTRSKNQFYTKMRNRIETEAAITGMGGIGDELSAFSKETRLRWFEDSKRLLQTNWWERECLRLSNISSVKDTLVSEWYHNRYS